MSIQLTLYPQQNEGVYTWDSVVNNVNKVADYNFNFAPWYFSNITQTTTSAVPHFNAVNLYLPNTLWGNFKTGAGSYNNVTAPSVVNGVLRLPSVASPSFTGCYQNIYNLTPGTTYTIEIRIKQSARGTLIIGIPGQPTTFQIGGNQYYHTGLFTNTFIGTTNTNFSVTHSFVADGTECVLMMSFQSDGTNSDTLQIHNAKVKQASTTFENVDDGQVVVDLYDHSPIPMTLSVDDFKKIAEKPQSFSKAFNLPATKHNNKIFSNIFDATISVHQNGQAFNPYLITKAVLREDGNTIFEGHLRLIDIKQKDGETTYTVNLFSTAVSLKTVLGNKTFADLDGGALGGGAGLSELEHIWTKAQIKPSWIGQLPLDNAVPAGYTGHLTTRLGDCTGGETECNVLKYPFVQWNGGITQEQGGSQHGYPELNHMNNAFRPWIKLKYLVDRIIGEAGFTYQSDFMEGIGNYSNPQGQAANVRKYPDFDRLFMDFNWGANVVPGNFGQTITATYTRDNASGDNYIHPANTWDMIQFTDGTGALESLGYDATNHYFVVPHDNYIYTISYNVVITNQNSSGDKFHLKLSRYNSSGTWQEDISGHWNVTPSSAGQTTLSGSGTTIAMAGDQIRLQAKKILPNPGAPNNVKQGDTSDTSAVSSTINVTVVPGKMTSEILLMKRGSMKQWEFIKDIMTMFNLIILQDKADPTKLKIEPYDDIFIDNEYTTGITQKTHDWTDKVDISEFEMKPLQLKKNVFWKHKEDKKDYAHGVYLDATGDEFGNMEITTNATVPSGEQKIELKHFASTFCKPLFNGFTNKLYVPQIVNMKSDGTIQGFDNKPRILYDMNGDGSNYNILTQLPSNNGVQKTYRIPSFNGTTGEQNSRFLQFGHVTAYPINNSQRDFNFGAVQMVSPFVSGTPRNLFNEFWSPYYDELYNSDTMVVKIRCLLSPQEMSDINFYDKIFIKNREYRINKIDYKAGELSVVELIRMP